LSVPKLEQPFPLLLLQPLHDTQFLLIHPSLPLSAPIPDLAGVPLRQTRGNDARVSLKAMLRGLAKARGELSGRSIYI
jgi:hypothetical protein